MFSGTEFFTDDLDSSKITDGVHNVLYSVSDDKVVDSVNLSGFPNTKYTIYTVDNYGNRTEILDAYATIGVPQVNLTFPKSLKVPGVITNYIIEADSNFSAKIYGWTTSSDDGDDDIDERIKKAILKKEEDLHSYL